MIFIYKILNLIIDNIPRDKLKIKFVQRNLQKLVFYYSSTQSLKGIATAGIVKAGLYIGQKLNKMNEKK